jgi:hypothetical protein
VRVHGVAREDRDVVLAPGDGVEHGGHVQRARLERVRAQARDADLVLRAGLDARGGGGEVREQAQALGLRARAAGLDERGEAHDLRGDRAHRAREHGVELAQVRKVPRELGRQRVERVCVLAQQRQRVGRVERGAAVVAAAAQGGRHLVRGGGGSWKRASAPPSGCSHNWRR